MIYLNKDIPCKTINIFNFSDSLKLLALEINLRKKNMLMIGCYVPPSYNDEYFLDQLHGALCFYGTTYDNFLLIGDFDIFHDDKLLREFCNSFSLGHIIKTLTCYIGSSTSSIDHNITNMTSLFMKPCTVETGISDYHKLIMSICRMTFAKGKSKKFFLWLL